MSRNKNFRYFYIVKSDWLHSTFPNPLCITILSVLLDVALVILFAFIFYSSLSFCGGLGGFFTLDPVTKFQCLSWQLGSNFFCIVLSSIFYTIILRQRGKFFNSNVGVEPEQDPGSRIVTLSQEIDNRRNISLGSNTQNQQEGHIYFVVIIYIHTYIMRFLYLKFKEIWILSESLLIHQ